MSLAGKVAIITGASSGIGWALAKELSAQGCAVGLIARREELLAKLAAEVAATGGKVAWAVADVTDRGSVEAAIASIRKTLGPIEIAVANAGVGMATLLDPVNVDDIEQTFRVNVLGVVYMLAAVMPEMLARKAGQLVAVSSIAGYRGLPGESAYCASKAAVNTYMDGLRIQLRGTGVYASTICPGFVTTPMTADFTFSMPGLMTAEYAARRIARAIRRKEKVANFPWRLKFLTVLSRWVPDWWIKWVMGGYSTEEKTGHGT
jgi:short-subunit dehydrogenase